MQCILMGKQARAGVSKKTGSPYNYLIVYVAYTVRGVDGQVCEEIWLDGASYPSDSLVIGDIYAIGRDSRGRVIAFDHCA